MPHLNFNISLQVQSDAQYKYLYEAVAAYAKRVRKGEKPLGNEDDKLPNGDEWQPLNGDEYVIDDPYILGDD